jgi:hypothetical protein
MVTVVLGLRLLLYWGYGYFGAVDTDTYYGVCSVATVMQVLQLFCATPCLLCAFAIATVVLLLIT